MYASEEEKGTDVTCLSSAFQAIRRGVKASYKFMKRNVLVEAAEADGDVRPHMSHVTAV